MSETWNVSRYLIHRPSRLIILAVLLFSTACQGDVPCSMRSLMPAERYWAHAIGPKNIWTESETEQFLCVAIQLEEGQEWYRVDKRSLSDRKVKERVFRRQAAGSVEFMRRQLTYSDQSPGIFDIPFEALEQLTGLPPRSAQEWIDWFDANQARLRLSPDGERLIVSSE